MTLFAIKVSSAWLPVDPSPLPKFIAMPPAPGIGTGGVLQRVANRAAESQIDSIYGT